MAYIPAKNEPIAIIGSHCRFPGPATTPSKLWDLLKDPVDLSRKAPSSRWNVDGFFHSNGEYHGATNAPKGYFLADEQDPRFFDASFFNITPREAEAIDPQGKILLEVVYDAMESAGLSLQRCNGERVGVFVGTMTSDYDQLTCKDAMSTSQYCGTGLSRALLSNRVSYFFNWSGPSMTIDTACSSSLVAMHQAVGSLRAGDSSVACVAGANIMVAPDAFMAESSLHMLSPTGYSRMWDEGADGYARGEGVGVLFLKTLSRALVDGDDIECVIRETGVNSDGRTLGITMPSSVAQTELILDTYRRSGLDPRNPDHRCQYFEAHGTGTQAGDPQEAQAIYTAFFGPHEDHDRPSSDTEKLLVGSIKTVIGHTEGAAGVAGVMKSALGLKNCLVPPNQHLSRPNPKVAPFLSRLKVPVRLTPWPQARPGHPQRASVNSFGFGGTNAHAILERYEPNIHGRSAMHMVPNRELGLDTSWTQPWAIPLLLSASTSRALARKAEDCLVYLESAPSASNVRDAIGTLAFHRSVLQHKVAFPASTPEQLIQHLRNSVEAYRQDPKFDMGARSKDSGASRVLGVFTGQGAQWPMMGKELIWASPIFRGVLQAMDAVLKACPDPPAWSIVDELLAPTSRSRLGEAALSQPLCTAIQVGLVDVLAASGVRFDTVVGHSSGEIAAAYAVGSLNAGEAILIAYYRGLFARLAGGANNEKGGMMAVGMGVEEAHRFCAQPGLEGGLFVAASNAPASVTLSGDMDAIKTAKAQLDEAKTFCRLLKVDTAYHSHHMDKCGSAYLASLESCNITPKAPNGTCIWVSSVYGPVGSPTTKELAARYWKDNMIQPVLFSDALARALVEHGPFDMALEVGPHPALKGPATQTMQETIGKVIPYHGVLSRGSGDLKALSEALGSVWCALGTAAVDWAGYMRAMETNLTSYNLAKGLPPYPWEHLQVHHRTPRTIRQYLQRSNNPHELLGVRTSDDSYSEFRWQNILKPTTVPWLRHHRFQGQIIVPAAAYCVMVVDAARAMVGDTRIKMIEIQGLAIRNGINMDEQDSEGVDTLFSLKIEDRLLEEGGHEVFTGHFSLDWSPANVDRPTKNAVSGRVLVHLGAPSADTALPRRLSPTFGLNKTDLNDFYASVADIGLSYTGPFRAITSLNRRRHFASAQLEKPHPEDTSELSIRPAMLDASFQSAFAAFAAPRDGLRFNMALCQVQPGQPSILNVDATITRVQPTTMSGPANFTSDIEIFNTQGQMEIQIEGLTVASLAASSATEDRQLYVHTVYKPDPWEGFQPQTPDLSNEGPEQLSMSRHLTHIVDSISHRHPRIRVLEIDLGSGAVGLSEAIWNGLAASYLSYTCARIQGGAFLDMPISNARPQKFTTVQLQSVAPLSTLGFELGHFDLVILFHPHRVNDGDTVLQGPPTSEEDSILGDVRRLIKAGGYLTIVQHIDSEPRQIENTDDTPLSLNAHLDVLETNGYSKPLHKFTFPKSKASLVVTQAMNSTVATLRSPLSDPGASKVSGTVLIVGGKAPVTQAIILRLKQVLSLCTACTNIITVPSLEEIDSLDPSALAGLRSAVILADLDAPILDLRDMTETRLANLQQILNGPGQYVLWLTRGFRNAEPYHAASVGLARTIKGETPQLLMQIIEIDDEGPESWKLAAATSIEDRVTEAFLRLALAREAEDDVGDVLWTTESEIVLSGGRALLPRVLPLQEANDRVDCTRRVVTRDVNLSSSIVQLVLEEEKNRLVYGTRQKPEDIENIHKANNDLLAIRALSTSAWALEFGGDGSYLHVGVGIATESGNTVVFASPTNSSWNVRYSTTDWEKAATNSGFVFIHPQSTQRTVQKTLPANLGAVVDFSADKHNIGSPYRSSVVHISSLTSSSFSLGNLAGLTLDSPGVRPVLVVNESLARSTGSVKQQLSQDAIGSSLLSAWERIKAGASSLPKSQAAYSPIRSLPEMIGGGLQQYFTVVNWKENVQIKERIRPLDPRSVLSPYKTYLLVGLTGELGESLCRFMVDHGARSVVVASRDPSKADRWATDIQSSSGGKATIHLAPLDVTDVNAVQALKNRLAESFPPVAGVVNGAMVLNDGLFADMTLENLVSTLKPKVLGTENLDHVFDDRTLDFFMVFSSLVCLTGNRGQANYSAANMYMAGLAARRRKRGLAASVLDIGMVIGIGYANRVDGTGVYENLRRQGYLPISEEDIHHMFVEAIAAGKPGSSTTGTPLHLSTGLQKFSPGQDNALPWHLDTRFSHHTTDAGSSSIQDSAAGGLSSETVKDLIGLNESLENITQNLTAAFTSQLETMLRLPAGSVDANCPIIDLGVDSLVAVEVRSWFLKTVEKDMPVLKKVIDNGDTESAIGAASSTDESLDAKVNLVTDSESTESSWDENDDMDLYDEVFRMSFSQARMWLPFLLLEDKTTYNCTTSYRLRGPLDIARFEAALVAVARKHQAFRTCFYTDALSGEPMQAVASSSNFQLKKLITPDDKADVDIETALISGHVFDLENGDVFRATLLSHSADYHTIVFGYHHIILDGVSWQNVLQEVERAYVQSAIMPTLPQVDYVDFTVKQRASLDSQDVRNKRDFWKRSFDGKPPNDMPLLPFAKVKARAPLAKYQVTEYQVMLDKSLVEKIKEAATGFKSTSFHFYLAVLQVMLQRQLNMDELCIGITDANRSDPAFMDTVGLLLDSLPLILRSRPEADTDTETFGQRLRRTRDVVYSAVSNSGVPLDVILDDVGVESSASTLPLFQALVNYRMGALKQKTIGDVGLEYLSYQDARHPFDFILTIDEEKDWGALTLSMQDYLYDRAAADTFMEIYIYLLQAFSSMPFAKVDAYDNFPNDLPTKGLQLGRGPNLGSSWSRRTLTARVDQMAREFPEDVAIREGLATYTYRDLSLLVNKIAAALVNRGAGPGTRVGVFSGPSASAVFSLLAILRIGAVYVPLDERNSDERLASIVADSAVVVVVVSNEENKTRIPRISSNTAVASLIRILDIMTILNMGATQDDRHGQDVIIDDRSRWEDLALIMFTSGTTGKPKGIMLTHGNMATHITAAAERMCLGRETVLSQSALGYDASLAQIFYALAGGGTLVISSNRREMSEVAALMRDEHVSLTLMAPSEYAALFQYGNEVLLACHSWRVAMVGGETFPPRLRLSFRSLQIRDLKDFNAYGPTEISVASNIGQVNYNEASLEGDTKISIGKTLPGYHVCLVDEAARPVPIGIPGQIAVSGPAVSAGYLNNEALTREKFLPSSVISSSGDADPARSSRWYLTGDMGRMSADGSLLHLGRINQDSQVKLRGIRIELTEISSSIIDTSRGVVLQAVVGLRGSDQAQFLVAYVVFALGREPEHEESYLDRLMADLPLPAYMRPAHAIPLVSLPTNASGKLDMAALGVLPLTPTKNGPAQDRNILELRDELWTSTETRLREIWETVLGDTGIPLARTSNFFSAGGNSLLLLRLQAEIRKSFNTNISLPELFRINTLSSLARKLNQDELVAKTTDTVQRVSVEAAAADERYRIIDWAAETAVPADILSLSREKPSTISSDKTVVPITSIILTGATGFLGRQVARELQSRPEIAQIHCIAVRDPSSGSAQALVQECPKATLYAGDLCLPRLGLSDPDTRRLFSEPGAAVVHNGADVSFMKPYEALRAPNVLATRELARLCLSSPLRAPPPLHYVSTAGVGILGLAASADGVVPAASLAAYQPGGDKAPAVDGYVASKWASEALLEAISSATGLGVRIYRPSSITGPGAPPLDIMQNVLEFSRTMGAVPDVRRWSGSFDYVRVETVARGIADTVLSLVDAGVQEQGKTDFIHLTGEVVVPVSEMTGYMERVAGNSFRELPMALWVREAMDIGLHELVGTYLTTAGADAGGEQPVFPALESSLQLC
ncbi:putative Hybrid PKS-NRPS biosynthetic cluster [Cytospora paraplurivora]|uniref:Hybrid PKS-NRPS biosynthetic cluster n=1 Tax=Cytospora paraplurivora TaxID=2898453 RepID=A0AAN9UL95_9PEZI